MLMQCMCASGTAHAPFLACGMQLPALLLPGLTLVVSPLIALMHDQAASVPPPVRGLVHNAGQGRGAKQDRYRRMCLSACLHDGLAWHIVSHLDLRSMTAAHCSGAVVRADTGRCSAGGLAALPW